VASPVIDSGVTDLEAFCAQLSKAIGALAAALPDLTADARGYDTLLPALRQEFDTAESAALALDQGMEPAGSRTAAGLDALKDKAAALEEESSAIGEGAEALATEVGSDLAAHASGTSGSWQQLWTDTWQPLREVLGQLAADQARWTEHADIDLSALAAALEEALHVVEQEKNETVRALERVNGLADDAEAKLAGMYLHAPTLEEKLESAFAAQTTQVMNLLAEWGRAMAGESEVTRSAVETLAAEGDAGVIAAHASLSNALEALAAELERVDMEVAQTAADATESRDTAEKVAALKPELQETEARVASIRRLMGSFEPT
jgi:hypothetical protein